MKKIAIFLSIIFYSILFSQNESDKSSLKIHYYMIMAPDSTLIKNQADASVYDYTLLCNTKKSIYADDKAKTFFDYIQNNVGNYGNPSINGYPKSKSSVYKDGDKVIVTLPIGRRDLYRYEEPALKWELIKNKSKTILSYQCNLAKTTSDTGKVYYAWYTTSIPISEGPFRFKGLNGLILEVYNAEKSIIIKAAEIAKVNELIEPLKYTKVYDIKEKSQFLKKRREFMEDPNIDTYQSPYKATGPDGKEIKVDKREPLDNLKENNLLD